MSILQKLKNKNLLSMADEFLTGNLCFEVITGSVSYGVSEPSSDMDIIGITVPPLDYIFPHLSGKINGIDKNIPNFGTFVQHHISDNEKNREYDVVIYNILNFFSLAIDNNPNIIDILFSPDRCILHIDSVGKILKSNKKLFLHKGAFHKFIGYSYSQLKKINEKNPNGKRKEIVEKYGYDVKYAYHIVRLALECSQILEHHDLNIESNSEILKSIRNGLWSFEDIIDWFKNMEENLNKLYINSTLRHSPNIDDIKQVFLCCIEEKYGSLNNYLNLSADFSIIRKYEQIKKIIES